MSGSLPERPDLDQLRRQAKELRDGARREGASAVERFVRHHGSAPQGAVTLAAAQLVIARELGFVSWPRLKAAVEAQIVSPERRAEAFVTASVEGRMREAATILDTVPDVASHSLVAAAVLGDSTQVERKLTIDLAAAVAIDEVRGWPPLLYACYSRWQHIDPRRAAGVTEVVRLLLDAGASPNTNDGGRPHHGYRSALHGSVVVNNPAITRLLLERGAVPNDGESLYQAAGHRDLACLELLLAHGATVAGTWALEVVVHADDPRGVGLLLDTAEQTVEQAAQMATAVLPDAAATASLPVVTALLTAGADPEARDSEGVSALRHTVRAGAYESASALLGNGAPDDATDIDWFVGACMRADRAAIDRLLAAQPDLRDCLTEDDRSAIVEAAGSFGSDAVALMLDLGFSPRSRNGLGETALHAAAYTGDAKTVRLLIDAGTEIDALDANFDATPLAFATVGSGEQAGKPGNWIEVVRLLIDAGATRHDVWISGKPPSEEVMDLLLSYGIRPDDEPEHQLEDTDDLPLSLGTE
jgi:ankyrin repeat protein